MHFVYHRIKIYCLNNIRANNLGKINKKCQCFIYNHLSPDYKSTKKYFLNNKSPLNYLVLGIDTVTGKTF